MKTPKLLLAIGLALVIAAPAFAEDPAPVAVDRPQGLNNAIQNTAENPGKANDVLQRNQERIQQKRQQMAEKKNQKMQQKMERKREHAQQRLEKKTQRMNDRMQRKSQRVKGQ